MKDYRKFEYTNENYLIFRTIETFSRTASGKSWKSRPDEVENEIVPPKHYVNYVTAIPFFNNFGDGASCRAAFSYNAPGYLPTLITTVSPFRETKKIACFWFFKKETLLLNAGYREKSIVENAKRFRVEYVDGAKMIYFYTDEDGDTASGILIHAGTFGGGKHYEKIQLYRQERQNVGTYHEKASPGGL